MRMPSFPYGIYYTLVSLAFGVPRSACNVRRRFKLVSARRPLLLPRPPIELELELALVFRFTSKYQA
jgi:hypothetical protein